MTSGEHDRDAGNGQRQQPRAVAERRTGAGRGLVAVSRPGVGRARFLAVRSFANVARGRLYRLVESSGASRCEQNDEEPVNPRSPPLFAQSPSLLPVTTHTKLFSPTVNILALSSESNPAHYHRFSGTSSYLTAPNPNYPKRSPIYPLSPNRLVKTTSSPVFVYYYSSLSRRYLFFPPILAPFPGYVFVLHCRTHSCTPIPCSQSALVTCHESTLTFLFLLLLFPSNFRYTRKIHTTPLPVSRPSCKTSLLP